MNSRTGSGLRIPPPGRTRHSVRLMPSSSVADIIRRGAPANAEPSPGWGVLSTNFWYVSVVHYLGSSVIRQKPFA